MVNSRMEGSRPAGMLNFGNAALGCDGAVFPISVRCGDGAVCVLEQLGCVPAVWQELCGAVGHKGSAVCGVSVCIVLGETW